MPIVNVSWIAGRTIEQKRIIVERITTAMGEVGVAPETLQIVFADVERENWASAGTLHADRQ